MNDLTNDELSALIEACNVASRHNPRHPWNTAGRSAWDKLLAEEKYRAGLTCEHGIRDGDYCRACNIEYKRAAMENEGPGI